MDKVRGLLFEIFPQVAEYVPPGPLDIVLFRGNPKIVSILDYSKVFGHTELAEL